MSAIDRPEPRRVVVTGMGAVTPVGNDVASTWEALVAGRSGVGPISTFDPTGWPVRIAGMVKDFDVADHVADPSLVRHLSRAGRFGLAATAQALAAAGAGPGTYAAGDMGIAMGCSIGRPELDELVDLVLGFARSDEGTPVGMGEAAVLERDPGIGIAAMARLAGCGGPAIAVSTACSAASHALGEALRRIQDGEVRLMIAGGCDALTSWLDVLGFTLLGALTKEHADAPHRASRPFSADRSGFVLGEGAVVAVLEDVEHARARGAPILAELAGYGASMNAYRITDAPPDGSGPDLSMRLALEDAGMEPADIDCVVAHGTGTPGNDLCETNAIRTALGDHARSVVVTAPKSMTGHLTAASGALNVLVAVRAINEGVVPPTINLDTPDPRLDLDYVPDRARPAAVRAAFVNAFAFGGTNAALVVRRAGDAA